VQATTSRIVKLEFRFVSDADSTNFADFYIDDVVVTAP